MAIYQGDNQIVDRYVGETLVTRTYQGDKLIFDAYSELSGTLPLAVRSRASQVLKNYTIYGESVQDGTPTPDNPVKVTGLGVRTVNLFNGTYLSYGIIAYSGEILGTLNRFAFYIPVEPNTSYTISRIIGASSYFYYGFTDAVPTVGMTCAVFGNIGENVTTKTLTNQNHKYLMFFFGAGKSENVMLVEGSTAPDHYIPPGYKLPLKVTAGGTTTDYPVYIGSEPLMRIPGTEYADYVDYETGKIVRQVKKLVLTGEETTQRYSKNVFFISVSNTQAPTSKNTFCLCNKYKYATGGLYGLMTTDMSVQLALTAGTYPRYVCVHDGRFDAPANLKSYFADQYAAGTPVTFWYALETPVEEDPPVPFPDITLPQGTVTIDIDGTLKPQATVKGRINPTA